MPYKNKQLTVLLDEDCELFTTYKYKWRIKASGDKLYLTAAKYDGKIDGKYKYSKIYFHRLLMNALPGQYVDHINGNTLDNRKANLRICTNQENCCNQKLRSNNKSGIKGVRKVKNSWIAQINIAKKSTYLGSFKTAEEAQQVYIAKAKEIHKEFRRIL